MTAFRKDLFQISGEFLLYNTEFVARVKRGRPITKAMIKQVLCRYYHVENYMRRVKETAPLKILQEDGHLWFENGSMFFNDKKVFPVSR